MICVAQVAAVTRRAGQLKSVNDPVADDCVEVLDLDQARVPVCGTERIDQDGRSDVGLESAHCCRGPGSADSTSGVAARPNQNSVARIYGIYRALESAPGLSGRAGIGVVAGGRNVKGACRNRG